jgi:hypothetical protein
VDNLVGFGRRREGGVRRREKGGARSEEGGGRREEGGEDFPLNSLGGLELSGR